MKKVVACVLLLALLSGCGAVTAEDVEAAREAAYQEGYDTGYAEGQEKASGDLARAENELNKRGVMLQEWKDAYNKLLAASGLRGDMDWRFLAANIQASNGDPIVYIDSNSRYYHQEDCVQLNDSAIAVHLSAVRFDGTEPCPVCEPVVWGETA